MLKDIFRNGDRVFDYEYKWGVVVSINDNENADFPIFVQFKLKQRAVTYTRGGYFTDIDHLARLSFTEYDFVNGGFSQVRPLPDFEKNTLLYVRDGKRFDYNVMTLGYPSNKSKERILKLEHKGIEIRTGNPEWGAEPDKMYFVILHGDVIEATVMEC